MEPANIKGENKDVKIEIGRSCTIFGFRSCSMHVLHSERFLLAFFSIRSKELLCFVHGQAQKSKQKNTTKYFV